ncbi:tyrosine-type recombinase/integrase [Actinokineospora guangxiensis]|uniref:Tyrosine-type recombinase/integrase n=1 Tax=Actinokineospora guangxiensis TaxID=1490288 RepID=A0ABW0EV58_9PSEU
MSTTRGRPDDLTLRRALRRWAFNPVLREGPDVPAEIQHALAWLQRSTKPVSTLRRDENVRALLSALRRNLDGALAAASVANRKRRIINALLEYAVKERELLERNPIPAARKAASAPKTTMAIDRRRVLNPVQARSLFKAVGEQARSGPRLVAFFGCLYFAGLRPEEAVALRRRNLDLPVKGWGTIHLERSEPHAGREWTDSGKNRDLRPLKQRDEDEVRPVPCPPELTAMLHHHIKSFGISQDGRIFRGERNDNELPKLTIVRAWKRARTDTFTPEVAASPLGATPYDLRHAACSTWLNAGVPATTVADWAGHSVDVLLSTYARCIDGTTRTMQTMIDAVLGTT